MPIIAEIGVILVNLSNVSLLSKTERIAQLVIAKHERADWTEVQELSQTERGEGGFGSTGVKPSFDPVRGNKISIKK
jgi:dUTP pyrophosphatase